MTTTRSTDKRSEAEQVLEILTRWDQRMQGHQTQKRAANRVTFRAPVLLYPRISTANSESAAAPITVWARNISPGGIGFIYKGRIDVKRIVVCLDPESGETAWFHAEVVRRRQVHNDFWEYGARFTGRASRDEALAGKKAPTA
jgi:hypothetical protein